MLCKLNIVPAIAAVIVSTSVGGYVSPASAEIYERRAYINRDNCFRARRVPARIEYNTRGQLLRPASRSWEGNMQADGARIVNRYNDEVYIQTSRVVEDQHVTLVPVPCKR